MDDVNRSSERRGPSLIAVMLVSIVTSTVVSAAMVVGLSRLGPGLFESTPDSVAVPEVLGMRPAAAGEILTGRGLRLLVNGERADASAEPGTIAEQQPLAGSRVEHGGSVTVMISIGTPQVAVPSVVGQPVTAARAAVEAAGLVVGEVQETGEGELGTVTATQPIAGVELDVGSSVSFIAAPSGIEVPDVVGQNRRRAEEALTQVGLKRGRIRWRFNDMRSAYVVLEQDPAAGTSVAPETEVELVLNEE